MDIKAQLELQRRYNEQIANEPRRAIEAARTMRDPDEMSREELIEFLEGVGVEIDRRWGEARLRALMKEQT